MPVDEGPRDRFRWLTGWLAVSTMAAVSGVIAWLGIASGDASSATPARVDGGHRARGASGGTVCQDRRAPVLRVLQFNIRVAMNKRGRVDVARIATEIKAVRPDLVSLNEVDKNTRRTRVDEPAALARATGLHVVFGPNLIYDGGPFGNAVLTRLPVVDSRRVRLPVTPGLEPRGLLRVVVRVGDRRVAFSSTHLSEGRGGRRSRLLQARAAARVLRSSSAPAILAGDLNSVPADAPARVLRRGLLDAQQRGGTPPGHTYPQTRPSRRFDYVLYDRRFAVVPGSTHVRASRSSDHRSVFTRLALRPRRHDGCGADALPARR